MDKNDGGVGREEGNVQHGGRTVRGGDTGAMNGEAAWIYTETDGRRMRSTKGENRR